MVLEYRLCFVVVAINRRSLHCSTFSQKPSLAPMPTHCVVDVDAPLLRFSLQPQQRLSGCCAIWVHHSLESCLRGFHFCPRAIYYRFSRAAGLVMAL